MTMASRQRLLAISLVAGILPVFPACRSVSPKPSPAPAAVENPSSGVPDPLAEYEKALANYRPGEKKSPVTPRENPAPSEIAAPRPDATGKAPPPASPALETLAAAVKTQGDAETLLKHIERRKAGEGWPASLLRVFYLATGSPEKAEAVRGVPGGDPARRRLARLLEFATAYELGMQKEAEVILDDVEDEVRRAAPLEIRNAVFATDIEGFGRYQAVPKPVFARGKPVLLYNEVVNFVTRETSAGEWHTTLDVGLAVEDAAGKIAWSAPKYSEVDYVAKCRLTDLNLGTGFSVPPELTAGEWVLRVSVEDKIGKKGAKAEVKFQVK
ncbi:MAG: hypothetical protein V1809_00680 [Planctomycetota bacterium]